MLKQHVRQERKDLLLKSILSHAAFDGWTNAALEAGFKDAKIEPIMIERYFPGGVKEVVKYYSKWVDRQLLDSLAAVDITGMRIRDRIVLAVKLRFSILSNNKEAFRRSITYCSLPGNISIAIDAAYRAVDTIWYGVGDRSADFSFYTKRALLYGVISTTTLVWLNDESEENADTWSFLDRRISDIMKINSVRSSLDKFSSYIPDPFKVLRTLRKC